MCTRKNTFALTERFVYTVVGGVRAKARSILDDRRTAGEGGLKEEKRAKAKGVLAAGWRLLCAEFCGQF